MIALNDDEKNYTLSVGYDEDNKLEN